VKYDIGTSVPSGGLEDQVLAKKTDSDFDTEWQDAGSGNPSDTVENETTFGISPSAGTESTYSRGDHTHGTQTNPVPGHVAEEDPHPTYALDTDLSTHEAASDPHTVYALDTDLSTHISASDPHTGYQKESEKGAASGYASLDATTKIPDSQIPDSIARDSEVTAERADHETDFNHALLHSNSLDHTQGTDQGLDNGGANAVTAAQTKTAYTHSQAAHAPSNAQKNSDILESEIEAKLTGEVYSHTHAAVGGFGYTLGVQALTSGPVDAATVYFGQLPKAPTTTASISKVYIRKAGTIKIAEIYCYSGTAGSSEAWSLYIRKNNSADTLIATLSVAASERLFSNTGLNIAVIAGDYIEIKGVQPTWVTNPLTTIYGGYIYIE
jgi:hypothetical protein